MLCADRLDLSQHFAKPRADKFENVDFSESELGNAVLTGNLALFECRKSQTVDGGDHTMFIGEVLRVECQIASNSDPLSRPIPTPSSWVRAGISM